MGAKKMFPPRDVGNPLGVRMSSAGARKLAAMLLEKANEQDRLGEGKSP